MQASKQASKQAECKQQSLLAAVQHGSAPEDKSPHVEAEPIFLAQQARSGHGCDSLTLYSCTHAEYREIDPPAEGQVMDPRLVQGVVT